MYCFLGPLFFDWGPGYVHHGFSRPLAFQFPVDGVGGGYFRYVDNILVIYKDGKTNIHRVLEDFQ